MASKRDKLRAGAKANFNAGHLRSVSSIPEAGDPLEPITITLTLDELTYYDRNPRQAENEAFDDILNETRALGGLDGVLPVTRRPGEKLYFPKRGGNTRLKALRQLYEETGNEAFFRIDCKVYPWTNEADVLSAHLADNDNRGGVIFIDRALGVRNLRRELEREAGKELSSRALSEKMKGTGYAVGHTIIQLMTYSVDTLLPLIPNALNQGLGKPRIEETRKLHNQLRQVWEAENPDTESFEVEFAKVLSESDDNEFWSLELVQQDLFHQIAHALNIPESHLHLSLTAVEQGHEPIPYAPASQTSDTNNDASSGVEPLVPPTHREASRDTPPKSAPDQGFIDLSEDTLSAQAAKDHKIPAATSTPPQATKEQALADLPATSSSDNIAAIRAANYELAITVAKNEQGLREDIFRWDHGYGFCVDVSTFMLTFENPAYFGDDDRSARARHLFLLLMALSENQAGIDRVKSMPSSMTAVKQLSESKDHYLRFRDRYCPPPRPETAGYHLFNNTPFFSNEQLENLFTIIMNNRRLRELSGDPTGHALFPPPVPDELLGLDPESNSKLFEMYKTHQAQGEDHDDD